MAELEQTRGNFKLIGKVVNIDRENAYAEKMQGQGKNKGKQYRQLRFGIQTAPDNIVQIGMFSYEPSDVYIWETEAKKGAKMPYAKWKANRKVLEKQKKIPLQTAIGIERDEKGKTNTQHLPSWDAIEYIHDSLFNGDSVVVEGQVSYSSYTNGNGDEVTGTNYNLERLFTLKEPVDFSSDKFEETSVFTQEFIYEGAEVDKKTKVATVFGKTIGYAPEGQVPKMVDVSFEISFEDDDENKTMEKMAKTYVKKVPYGSYLKVHGNVLNKAISELVEDDDNDDDVLAMLGGEKNRMQATITYKRAMEIRGTDAIEQSKYTEEDLAQTNDLIVEEKEEDDLGDLTGKKKSKTKIESIVDEDEDDDWGGEGLDIDDSDLPF